MRKIRLLEAWRGCRAGAVIEVSEMVGKSLVRDKVAEWADEPSGKVRPQATKIKSPAAVKG